MNTDNIDPKMIDFCNAIKKRLSQDWDCIIAITGESGKGKSVLAIQLSQLIDPDFSMEKNMCFIPNGDEIREKFKTIKRKGVLLIDEAVRSLHKHSWADKTQQAIIRYYDTNRYRNVCTFLLVPRFFSLSEHLRNFRVNIWIDVIERGRAIVYTKIQDKDEEDVWKTKDNQKLKAKHFGYRKVTEIDISDRIVSERKLSTYTMEFKFNDIDEATKEEYLRLKEKSREYEDDDFNKRSLSQLWKDRFIKITLGYYSGELKTKTVKGIAEYIQIPKTELSTLMKNYEEQNKKEKDTNAI